MSNLSYKDDEFVRQMSICLMDCGINVFQIHRMNENEEQHVIQLLKLFNPLYDSIVVDAGCGVGGVSALMSKYRPDLNFILLNNSRIQLDLCPDRFHKINASFDDIPLNSASVDAVMFNYSLGHGLLDVVIPEASRILRKNGILFIYDIASLGNTGPQVVLEYNAYHPENVILAAEEANLQKDMVFVPKNTSVDHFIQILGKNQYNDLFQEIFPIVYRFIKQ
jgi:ubiquinone/menaquinone biosynthesis C-methylase UbiE